MSNTRAWRAKQRTSKPNARQKRNGLFLDAHPVCQDCGKRKSREAHHDLPHGHPDRYLWQYMRALCTRCHVARHQVIRSPCASALRIKHEPDAFATIGGGVTGCYDFDTCLDKRISNLVLRFHAHSLAALEAIEGHNPNLRGLGQVGHRPSQQRPSRATLNHREHHSRHLAPDMREPPRAIANINERW